MNTTASLGKRLAKVGGRFVGHLGAIILGLVLMIGGLGLGVTLVALPIGLLVGLGGLLMFLWGLFAWPRDEQPKQRQ
jgi:hypothetical protein